MFKGSLNVLAKTWQNFMPTPGRLEDTQSKIDARLDKKIRTLVNECLVEKGGEVSARQRAVRLGSIYLNLELDQRARSLVSWRIV